VVEIVGEDLMVMVTIALAGSTPEAVQEVRRLMQELQAHQVEQTPVLGLKRVPPVLEGDPNTSRRSINRPPRKHDENARDKAGRDAEMLVVASDRPADAARRAGLRQGDRGDARRDARELR
jgi:hypothetical protein